MFELQLQARIIDALTWKDTEELVGSLRALTHMSPAQAGAVLQSRPTGAGERPPVHTAAAVSSAAAMRMLLEHGADVNAADGPEGDTPLHVACRHRNGDTAFGGRASAVASKCHCTLTAAVYVVPGAQSYCKPGRLNGH